MANQTDNKPNFLLDPEWIENACNFVTKHNDNHFTLVCTNDTEVEYTLYINNYQLCFDINLAGKSWYGNDTADKNTINAFVKLSELEWKDRQRLHELQDNATQKLANELENL